MKEMEMRWYDAVALAVCMMISWGIHSVIVKFGMDLDMIYVALIAAGGYLMSEVFRTSKE